MSGKLVIVAILALHVSITSSELPQPDQELVEKYNQLKDYISMWLYVAAIKTSETKDPVFEIFKTFLRSKAVKDSLKELTNNPHVKKFDQVTTSIFQKDVSDAIWSLVDKARTDALGLYGAYVRPWAEPILDEAVTGIKKLWNSMVP